MRPENRLRRVYPVCVFYDPVEKVVELMGPKQCLNINLDVPALKCVDLLLDVWTAEEGLVDFSPEVFGIDHKDFCDGCGRADDDCVCDED